MENPFVYKSKSYFPGRNLVKFCTPPPQKKNTWFNMGANSVLFLKNLGAKCRPNVICFLGLRPVQRLLLFFLI
jgi:hypothetical protein